MLTRERLQELGRPSIRPFTHEDPTGAVEGFVRSLPAKEMLTLRGGSDEQQGFRLIQHCLCDADGKRLLGDGPEDLAIIETLPHGLMLKLVDECLTVNRMNKKGFKEAEKNSATP